MSKARLLWRSDLVLVDGTRLAGIAIVSYADPFGDAAAADLCLALEMLRNQPLNIASVPTDRPTHWIPNDVRVYIDPRETATWSFFQRVFCFDADFVQQASGERSAQLVLLSPNGPQSEFAIFAQRLAVDEPAPGADSMPIRLVVGRRAAAATTKTSSIAAGKDLARSRSFSRQQSIGSQTLQDVFSQAGLSLPTFGGIPTLATGSVPRPDDPLPRGSISALLKARSKRKPAHTERHRGASPVATGSQAPPAQTGTHTPGRRGKKRRATSDRKVAGSPDLGDADSLDPTQADYSPTKAIRHRADRILSDLPRLNLGKQPTRSVVPSPQPGTQLLDVKPIKFESASPEPFLHDKDRNVSADPSESVEKTNRNTIKKVVHTILVREYGLSKTDRDYIATYNQTCSGTWCTFRNTASTQRLTKDAIESVVRIHLSMYLYSNLA